MIARAKAILDSERARENASVSRETPLEHRVILNREAKGKSEGSNPAPLKVYQGQVQQEVARTIGGGAPFKMNIEAKSEC